MTTSKIVYEDLESTINQLLAAVSDDLCIFVNKDYTVGIATEGDEDLLTLHPGDTCFIGNIRGMSTFSLNGVDWI